MTEKSVDSLLDRIGYVDPSQPDVATTIEAIGKDIISNLYDYPQVEDVIKVRDIFSAKVERAGLERTSDAMKALEHLRSIIQRNGGGCLSM